VADDSTLELQALIERIGQGNQSARRELVDRAYSRLRKLVAKMLHGSFPALKQNHDLDSVAHEGWLRLAQAIEGINPPTVADFFRLAAFKVRQVLLDLADQQKRRGGRERIGLSTGVADDVDHPLARTYDPAKLAEWSEFHGRVADLPADERSVFEMHYYLGLTQAEIARILERHPRQISYLWVAATDRLAANLKE
jgi:RNA polymerase sigma factor (sigma-70 family)